MSIHPDTLDALRNKTYAHDVTLVRFDFTGVGGGIAAYASGDVAIKWDGVTYQPNGLLLEPGDVKESSELRIEAVSFEFTGVDTAVAALFLNNDYIGVPTQYLRAFLDSRYAIIGEPVIYFLGTVTGLGGSGDEASESITIEADHQFANFDAVNGRRMNPRDIERVFPNDKGGEFAGESRAGIRWGK